MPTVGTTSKPAYVYDAGTDTWVPVGVGAHTHDTSALVSVNSYFAAGKNHIINGGFDIWQRGTSFANTSAILAYTADRWYQARNATGMTISRQTTNDTTNLPFIQYCARVSRNSGNTSTEVIRIVQSLETLNSLPFVGQPVTFSFYARKGANYSDASSAIVAQLLSGTGTDQNVNTISGVEYPINSTATLTTTWQKFSFTGTVSSSATQLHVLFYGIPVGTAGANDYFEITGVQLEVGSTATPFSRAGGTIQGELAAAQRYYFRNTASNDSFNILGHGIADSTTRAMITTRLPVTMRTHPSSVEFATLRLQDSVNASAITSLTLATAHTSRDYATVFASVASGLTQYRPYFLDQNNSTAGYLGFSAEL